MIVGAIEAGVAVRIEEAAEVAEVTRRLLNDPKQRAAMSQAGNRFINAHRGATQKTLALLRW